MNLTSPKLTLTFLGNDLPAGRSASQVITDEYIIKNSMTLNKTLLSGLRSASNQMSLSLSKNCASVEDIIATDGDIKAVLSDGLTTLFTGYISTSFSWKVTQNGEQVLGITLEDTSTRLLTKPFIDTGYHLFNATASEAIDDICDAAGIVVSSSAIQITDRIVYVAEAGQSCRELLDQMLYELGYVYYCDNLGELRFFKVDVSSLSDLPIIDKDDLYEKNGQVVTLSKKIRQYRSVRMTYKAIGTANNYLVYRNTTGADDAHPYCNMELQSGEHFDGLEIYTAQEWSEATADEFREPALIEACNAASETTIVGSNKIIAISELQPLVDKDSDITITMTHAGGPFIEINAQNNGNRPEYIFRMDLFASILYEKSQNIVRTGISGNTTDSLLTEDCGFIHTRELMTRHANLVCQYNAYCNSRYTFFSEQDLSCGSLIHLNENVFSGLAVDVMIIGKSETDKSSLKQYTAIGVSVFSLDDDVYHRDTDSGKASTKGERGTSSRWLNGTALYGTAYARGVAGNEGDYYLNTQTYNIYRCVLSGGANTAVWQYIGNNKGQDASTLGFIYELEYGLSTSPVEFVFPVEALGYDSNSYGINSEDAYGFSNYIWKGTFDGWYKGLYVWQRLKITDAEGIITYGEPSYSEEVTTSLINGCLLTIELVDSDGDGNTHTWEKNLASASGTVNVQFRLSSRCYESISAFEEALQSVSVTPYKGQSALTPITLPSASSKTIDSDTKTVVFVYSLSFAKKQDYDSLVINASITDTYLKADGSTWSVDTQATESMNAVDITEYDVFAGIFSSDSEAEAFFNSEYEGIIEGYTYSCSHEGYEDHLALKTYFNGAWIYMSNLPSSFSLARVSAICARAQKAVLSQIPAGTVTMSDFGYFNIVIANVVTSRFIGSKQIQLQVDDQGNPGYIYGGDVNTAQSFKNRVGTKGFIIDTLGQMEASEAYFKNCEIDGASIVSSLIFSNGAEINHPYFKTTSTQGEDMPVQQLPSKTHWYTGDINWNTVFPTANSFTSFSGSYINNSTTISRGIRVTNPNYALIASGTTVGSATHTMSGTTTSTLVSSVQYRGTYTLSLSLGYLTQTGAIRVNGTDVVSGTSSSSRSISLTLNPGDSVTCWSTSTGFSNSTFSVVANSVTLSGNGYPNVGIYLIGGSTYFYNSFNEYKPSSTRWYFKNGSGTVLFDSDSNIRYAHLESIVTGYMGLLEAGKTYTATGSVIYNGVNCTVATISKDTSTTGRLTVFDSVPNFYVLPMAANEYVNVSGDVQILVSRPGIITHAIYPEDTETYDIGEGGKQYRRIYCVNVVESSRRDLKTNIEPFTDNAIDLLKTVEVSKYNLKCDMELPDEEIVDYIGFIADDTDTRLSGKKHDKFNHINCIGVLIKAVQQLSEEIDRLKGGR